MALQGMGHFSLGENAWAARWLRLALSLCARSVGPAYPQEPMLAVAPEWSESVIAASCSMEMHADRFCRSATGSASAKTPWMLALLESSLENVLPGTLAEPLPVSAVNELREQMLLARLHLVETLWLLSLQQVREVDQYGQEQLVAAIYETCESTLIGVAHSMKRVNLQPARGMTSTSTGAQGLSSMRARERWSVMVCDGV